MRFKKKTSQRDCEDNVKKSKIYCKEVATRPWRLIKTEIVKNVKKKENKS